tara:strand:+ start:358 stop:801 length:444 start_codon:yes stop_codon:yes gene_type:complete
MWEKILKANDITQVHISDEVESGYLKDISVAAYGGEFDTGNHKLDSTLEIRIETKVVGDGDLAKLIMDFRVDGGIYLVDLNKVDDSDENVVNSYDSQEKFIIGYEEKPPKSDFVPIVSTLSVTFEAEIIGYSKRNDKFILKITREIL